MKNVTCFQSAMDFFRRLRLPTLEGLSKTATPVPVVSVDPKLQLQARATKQEIKPDPENDGDNEQECADEEEWVDRRDFEHIQAIEDSAFKKLLLQHLDPNNELEPADCTIDFRDRGTFNLCAMLTLKGKAGHFVIKVPAHGTASAWTDSDAFNLRNEVYSMKYIRRHTKVPVPEIYGWDNTLDNVIGAPYVIMAVVDGMPAYELWIPTNPDGTKNYRNMDEPSPEHAATRRKFLKNLASTMAELRHLQFEQAGMLHFEEDPNAEGAKSPTVGHFFEYKGDGTMKECPAYSSTQNYLKTKWYEFGEAIEAEGEMSDELFGVHLFCNMETFVLTHPDLDLQNVFVNREGEITGIIDWDGVRVVPRCIGHAALPLFLRKDWDCDYDIDDADHMPWIYNYYRNLYSQYVKDAISTSDGSSIGDAKFTPKSGLYCAAWEAMENRGGAKPAFVDRMFKEIPGLRAVDQEKFLKRLGGEEGWARAETMLISELGKLFAP
ncbi:hypothetical protein BU26DRAFT_50382 [Trematosphaeria pertusa]|uniref:Aminoglycoside phosphotransferase domain-containing protein n=1 Tax=Trematosphaeria pertusa TaxID=390896 RepID=A0A6A6I8T5_9PLEO|nr:uncharacterized protein BU26DRAFT_50382 [Trematosphaeria pertusa]KAF2246629.1 hypothetical protein BU26DRAFT_50382 [Trematosphaeria pertusa]